MANELRECPFCGAAGKLFSHQMDDETTIWWVQCQSSHCLARRHVVNSKEEAIADWNERNDDPA